jgi:DNA-nicking Smr family endonuclease
MKKSIPITDVLDLHPFTPRDVKMVVEEYLYQCAGKRFRFVRIIHGKGIGFQREMVRSILSKSEFVESFEEGPDWGSTAVILKPQMNTDEH